MDLLALNLGITKGNPLKNISSQYNKDIMTVFTSPISRSVKIHATTAFWIILALTCGTCSDELEPGCYQGENRRIVDTIMNVRGTISADECEGSYIIEPDERIESSPIGLFFPCNLTNEFQKDELKVVFSGYVYESFATEDICADYFELTEISLFDQ